MIKRFHVKPLPPNIILLLLLVILVAVVGWFIRQRLLNPKVTDFDSCVATGNPVLETDPVQCTYNGQSFFPPGEAPYNPKNDLIQ